MFTIFCKRLISFDLSMWSILNEYQKDRILKLKSSGRSYREIASALSISEGTIKSFFRRQKLKSKEVHTVCKNCGATLEKRCGSKKNFAQIYVGTNGGGKMQKAIENT